MNRAGTACRNLVVLAMIVLAGGCSQHYEEGSHPPPMPPPSPAMQGGSSSESGEKPAGAGTSKTEGKTVSGTISIAPALASRVPSHAYLFILALQRPDGGPPYALQRIPIPRFPYHYTLSQANVGQMFGDGIVFSDIPEMYLVAKIDQDGMVGTQPGDMEGSYAHNPVAAGKQGVDIVIDKLH